MQKSDAVGFMQFSKQLCCQQLLLASATGNSEVHLCEILATFTTTPNKAHVNAKSSQLELIFLQYFLQI